MLKISVDAREVENLVPDAEISPERLLRVWKKAMKNLAIQNAQAAAEGSGGRGFWQREVIPSVHDEIVGDQAVVYSDSYIAEHVHTGGVIRPVKSRFLAIPLPGNGERGKWPSDYGEDELFAKTSKAGNLLLFERPGKGRELKAPLFVLKEQVTQKPRPWWPTSEQVDAETARVLEEDF